MQINIDAIQVNSGRREALPEAVRELADSISAVGLLNPITVDRDYTLIAGLHRLEAAKLLGWSEIECHISTLEGLQAELAEIDENFVRTDLETVEFGKLLMRRKEIYEILHPETRCGVSQANAMNRAQGNNVSERGASTSKSFTRNTAKKLGISARSVEENIQIARDITPKAQEVIQGSDRKIKKKDLLKLSRMEPEQQEHAAAQLAAGKIKSADEFQPAEPPGLPKPARKLEQSKPAPKLKQAEPRQEPKYPKPMPEPKQPEPIPEQAEQTQKPEQSKLTQKPEQTEPVQEQGQTSEPITKLPSQPSVPYTLGDQHYDTLEESIADLKNPDKDCSYTPDTLLADIDGFVQTFHKGFAWYHDPFCTIVFPRISKVQFEFVRQRFESISTAMEELLNQMERTITT
ncbi:chromosome partitioning protein ParB [Enterococcus faecium]|nr:chromosome partitioning protein ParB [Enterococcus faecium]